MRILKKPTASWRCNIIPIVTRETNKPKTDLRKFRRLIPSFQTRKNGHNMTSLVTLRLAKMVHSPGASISPAGSRTFSVIFLENSSAAQQVDDVVEHAVKISATT